MRPSHESQPEDSTFEAFYDSTADKLYRYIYYKMSLSDVSDDIFQEAYIRIHARFNSYNSETHRVRALYTIARNLIIDYYRKDNKKVSLEEREMELVENDSGAGESIDSDIAKRQLARAISTLPESDQEIILSHSIAEIPYEELSKNESVPESTLRKRHSRALQKLATQFANLYGINYKPY